MQLSPGTKIDDLLKAYPFLEAFLIKLSPKFKLLKNPMVRNTLGKMATLQQVSGIGGIEISQLLNQIASKIEKETGEPLGVEGVQVKSLEERQELLKGLIKDLHNGQSVDQVKERFRELFDDVSPFEISQMEQALIQEGLPQEQVQLLCNVHVDLFKVALDKHTLPGVTPGHPVESYLLENKQLQTLIFELNNHLSDTKRASEMLDEIAKINIHYTRKENQLFPALEQHSITGPTQVMWAVHDKIRKMIKDLRKEMEGKNRNKIQKTWETLKQEMEEMIYKEEHILFPMCLETLSPEEWQNIKQGDNEIGYVWIEPPVEFKAEVGPKTPQQSQDADQITLNTGTVPLILLDLALTTLPIEMSIVDEKDEVVYYSGHKERIFPRSPQVIGRKVQQCHPPKSVHMVQAILDDFKSGTRDHADFWIQMQGKFIYIRYLAIRDNSGDYCGTLEVTQDVTAIRELTGEKRLLD